MGTMASFAVEPQARRRRASAGFVTGWPRYSPSCQRSASVSEAYQPFVVSLSCVPVYATDSRS